MKLPFQTFIFYFLAFYFINYSLLGQPKMDIKTSVLLQQIQKSKTHEYFNFSEVSMQEINSQQYLSVLVNLGKNSPEILNQPGFLVGGVAGNIASVRVQMAYLNSINNLQNDMQVCLAKKLSPNLDRAIFDARVDSVYQGIDLPQGYSGKNVFVGVLDWGFDFTHPNFYDTSLATNRIFAAWDQYKNGGTPPVGFSYGAEIVGEAALLSHGSDTSGVYGNATHGSHVAGIAAGSGGGTPYRGVAYSANFLFASLFVDEAAALDAFVWMKNVAEAEGKRLVINNSWGLYQFGSLDGKSLLSQAIDNLSDEGVCFVTSGGNNGDVNFHLSHQFNNDSVKTGIGFGNLTGSDKYVGQRLHIWGAENKTFKAQLILYSAANERFVESLTFETTSDNFLQNQTLVYQNDTTFFDIFIENKNPQNQRSHLEFIVKTPPAGYKLVLKLASSSGTVHLWNVAELSNNVGNWGLPLTSSVPGTVAGDNLYGIGEPASTKSVISVAAHNTEVKLPNSILPGDIAYFSSIGPTYTGELKPNISAPGVGIASSVSSFRDDIGNPFASTTFNGKTYHFSRFSGTSMAGPMVTGVVALMLEANPNLTPTQVKQILEITARSDSKTGAIPIAGSPIWGHGKVHAHAAVKMALQMVSIANTKEFKKVEIYPNPANNTIFFSGFKDQIIKSVLVYDAQGNLVKQLFGNQVNMDIANFSMGLYFLIVEDSKGDLNFGKFIKY